MKKYFIACLLSSLSIHSFSQAPVISLAEFSSGYTSPVGIENCGDSRLFIVQQNGYIYMCDSTGTKNPTPFLDVHLKIIVSGEQGLLGLAFDPDYLNNRTFYIYYTRKGGTWNITVLRYKTDSLDPNKADTSSAQVLMSIPHPTYSNHDGGCLKFGADGYLYIGTGDGGSGGDPDENGQDHQSYLGKLLRIDVHTDSLYAIPADNPFLSDTTFYPEIWAYGLRDPWRFSFDRITHDLWIGDVGQGLWEEVDYITYPDTGGQNYGWDCYEGTHEFEPGNCSGSNSLTWPVHEYNHTGGDCSLTGGFVYRGCKYLNLYGKYIFTDYCSGKFRVLEPDGNGGWTTTQVADLANFTYSTFGEDRSGELYVAGITEGKIYRVTDTSLPSQLIIQEAISDSGLCVGNPLNALSGDGLSLEWSLNGSVIAGATDDTYVPTVPGDYTVQVMNDYGCVNMSPSIYISDYPVVEITGLNPEHCIYLTSVALTGDPAGGTFSGTGVSGNVFNPNAAGAGIHTIYYTFANQYGCVTMDSQSVTVNECTGLNGEWEQSGVNIFPNPGDGTLSILLKDTNDALEEISVFNVAGQLIVKFSEGEIQNGAASVHLDLNNLSNGIYALKIIRGERVSIHKVIINH